MKLPRTMILLLGAFVFHGCSSDSLTPTGPGGTDTVVAPVAGDTLMARLSKPDARGIFVDARDGRSYPWVQIGRTKYMAANLAYVPKHGKTYVHTEAGLDSATSLARYGRSYDYEAMIDSTPVIDTGYMAGSGAHQGACPDGWALPSTGTFMVLVSRANRAWPYATEGFANTVLDSIFMDWATSEEEGGSNSLGLSFRRTYGTDLVCDSTELTGPTKCKEIKGWAISFGTHDTANGDAMLNSAEIGETARYNNYNVYRYRAITPGRAASENVAYTSASFRRKFSEFSAIRCIQAVKE